MQYNIDRDKTPVKGGNMRKYILFSILLTILLVAPGCKAKLENLEIKPAPIHEVDIRFAESYPVQVFVYIKGGLSDGCTTFKDVSTTRKDTAIEIAVSVQRPLNKICTAIYGYFEQNVALGSDFMSGNTYTVKVNDITKTFIMP
jgi:hypothetical protein